MTVAKVRAPARGAFYAGLLWLLAALLLITVKVSAQPGPVISEIRITGNQRVETGAIKIHVTSQVGQPLSEASVDADTKAIYRMGFFEDVTVSFDHDHNILTYRVKERPLVTEIRFSGMKAVKASDSEVINALALHSGSVLDPTRAETTIRNLEEVYQSKGYLDAKVIFRTVAGANNTAMGVFDVTEGPVVRISAVRFVGNKHFSARQLRGSMETRPHNLLSYFFQTGILDRKKLQDDVDRVTAFYYDHGYLNVHVFEPVVTRTGNSLVVTVTIDEGPVYKVGTLDVAGDLKAPKKELLSKLTLKHNQTFSGSDMQHDVLTLSDFYSDRGYAYVNVDPRTQVDPATRIVDVTFNINPGREVLVDRIKITGNTKTSDKVIRRELIIQEQEPYSTGKIQKSKQRLDALGYFSNTRISTSPGSTPDKIDLDINVQEANTAALQVGGGYDSYASVFGNFSVGNTNLFGGGESVSANAQIGFLYQNYSVSYTEPWFLDMPLSVSLQAFYNKLFLFSFDQTNAGFQINTGYPLTELGFKKIGPLPLDDVTAGLGYQFESVGISGLSEFTTFDIQRYKGYTRVSELTPSIRRFTIDNPTDPRTGSVQSLNLEVAGLGGSSFVKGVFHTRFFIPYIKSPEWGEWVFSPGFTYGIGTSLGGNKGSELPLYERFFPGGLGGGGDVRGYELYSLGPQVTLFNQQGAPFAIEQVGGSQELLLSGETTFPIWQSLGIRGAAFIDAGNAFLLHNNPPGQSFSLENLQAAYGAGIRWHSPFGPIAVDIARPINPRPNDQHTVFDFGAGAPL
ncbi:MAG TPA: outer membrane protein assembly factor BamA [Candidatus Binataceae bacterium]|nr:outer membrane protein assembly factor BamA [Candidatus Binataceae bacterium]